jgi:hypothetical protein
VDESNIEVLDITYAEYVSGYKIHLWFNDGKNHVVDFEPFLMNARNPMAVKYRDIKEFKKFSLDYGNLQWNDYEMCFSLEDLYNNDIDAEISVDDRQKLEELARQFGYSE